MNTQKKPFNKDILQFEDVETTCDNIVNKLKDNVYKKLTRRGAVVGISGGIDSTVSFALAVRAFGSDKVLVQY